MKKVALVGFAPSRLHAPFDDPDVEIWGCNEGYVRDFPRITRWFQLHSRETFTRAENHNDPNHYQWLKSVTDFPIYMQKKFRDVPRSVKFPLEEIRKWLKLEDDQLLYATSSFAYMILLAMYEGFDWIGVYGFEMATGTEYFHQRPNAEYYLGWARGRGIHVELPKTSNLLRGRLYAYEDDSIGFRQMLEFRGGVLKKQLEEERQHFSQLQGRNSVISELVNKKVELTQEKILSEQQSMIDSSALANTINGALKEVEMMIEIYDRHNGSKAVDDELKKEIGKN